MVDRTDIARCRVRRPRGRAGFSFAEVLFAVIILGVGFIMVAAIFPVAIQQTQSTAEDAAAAAAARQAAAAIAGVPGTYPNPQYISALPPVVSPAVPDVRYFQTLATFPPTVKPYTLPTAPGAGVVPPPAVVTAFSGARWEAIRDNVVLSTDPRYAYVPFYRRENGSPVAQLIVVAVAARNAPVYGAQADTLPPVAVTTPGPKVTVARQLPTAPAGALTTIYPDLISYSTAPTWASEGCYVPTNGFATSMTPLAAGAPNGRSYRLGRQIIGAAQPTYELEAADGLSAAAGPDGLWGTPDDVIDIPPPPAPPTTLTQVGQLPLVSTATLQPTVAYAAVFSAAGSLGGRITLAANLASVVGAGSANVAPGNAVPGAFVIVADDYPYGATAANPAAMAVTQTTYTLPANPVVAGTTVTVGALNGRIFRLGQPVPVNLTGTPPVYPGTFELDPQYPAPPVPYAIPITGASGPWARVYLVGAARTNNTLSAGNNINDPANYSGPAQDIGVYTTYFPVP